MKNLLIKLLIILSILALSCAESKPIAIETQPKEQIESITEPTATAQQSADPTPRPTNTASPVSNEIDPIELEASKYDLSYIKLDGTIGCMVNGAGLAMATLDIIKLYGSEPANFLDVGGGASKEKVSAAFKIILSDKNVKGILINIFGGIMRCDVLAQGVVDAAKEINLSVPLVVRLAGTNVKLGKEILEKSNLKIISANNLSDAAKKIVEVTK